MEIRKAYLTDIQEVMPQAHNFLGFHDMEFTVNEDHLTAVFASLIRNNIFLVSVKDGVITGGIAGLVTSSMFDPSVRIISESFWWVLPEFRGSSHAYRLLKRFEDQAKEVGCKYITLSRLSKSPVNHKTYEKAGYSITEETWFKGV